MASWNPIQYGAFLEWRTRPSRDLAQRVNIVAPRNIVDLGCGPGNSTAVCAERWPSASILGLDSSSEMIATARATQPERRWTVGDISEWALQPLKPDEQVDLIFSSAALQWIGDHATAFPRLAEKLSPGGVLAVQMPALRRDAQSDYAGNGRRGPMASMVSRWSGQGMALAPVRVLLRDPRARYEVA